MKILFEQSIRNTCQQDYTPAQIEAWCATVHRDTRWIELIEQQYVLIAEEGMEILGFASLKDDHYVDFLYVSQRHAGKGIAKTLLAQLAQKSLSADQPVLISDLSITAKKALQKAGWIVIRENQNLRNGEVLINYRMEFPLK